MATMYTPHLKKVLKSYQAAATSSLQGPNGFMPIWADDATKVTSSTSPPSATVSHKNSSSQPHSLHKISSKTPKGGDGTIDYHDPFLAPPPFPIQQPPILTPADKPSTCEHSDTILDGETIACFDVGGEKRLCFPQILNTVLKDFSLQQINSVFEEMQIFCSRCTVEQLEVLKMTGVLPLSAPSCGLITKSDAERLSAALLETREPKKVLPKSENGKGPYGFKVVHHCFGKTKGYCYPEYYSHPHAPCIECLQCKGMFDPKNFIRHVHHPKQNKTCHWGFDSDNWRHYLGLDVQDSEYETSQEQLLKELKKRFDYAAQVKRKLPPPDQQQQQQAAALVCSGNGTVTYWCPPPSWPAAAPRGEVAKEDVSGILQLPALTVSLGGGELAESCLSSPGVKKIKTEPESTDETAAASPSSSSEDVASSSAEGALSAVGMAEMERLKTLLNPLEKSLQDAILEEVNALRLKMRQELESVRHSERLLQKEVEELRPLKQQIVAEAKRRLKDAVLFRKDYVPSKSSSSNNTLPMVLVKQE